MGGGQLSARLLDASYGPELQEINRACPIVSGLTFWFDRGEDFFRWPGLVYDRFFYVGIFAGGDLVGYCMAGLTRAWTGRDLGWLAVLGDARVLPEHRGLGWIDVALEKLAEVVPLLGGARPVHHQGGQPGRGPRQEPLPAEGIRRASGRPPDGAEPACDAPEATACRGSPSRRRPLRTSTP